jgi:Pyridoxamine 5'-phosphate oxidase
MTEAECFELLSQQQPGPMAVTDERRPVVLPVTFVLDRPRVVFRTGEGTKLDADGQGRPGHARGRLDRRNGSHWLERPGPRRGRRGHRPLPSCSAGGSRDPGEGRRRNW